jgi:streptogramin lyase
MLSLILPAWGSKLSPSGTWEDGLLREMGKEVEVIRVRARLLITIGVVLFCLQSWSQNGVFQEWSVPTADSLPLHIVPGSSSVFYFTESNKNRVAQLDTSANAFTEWVLPAASMPHGIVFPSANTIAFCAFNGNYVGVLNTSTSVLTEWGAPTANSGTIHLDISGSTFFFTEANANQIALLDPVAGQITEWPIPTPNATPRGVAVGQNGEIFVAELNASKIAMLNTVTNTITEWTLPGVKQVEHLRFYNGAVYFGDLGSSIIGALIPSTNTLIDGPAPTPNAAIPDVFVSSGLINFTERSGNKIGRFNPALQKGKTTVLKPVVTSVTPQVSAVTPTTVTLPSTLTPVQPSPTNVSGVVNGGFTEWAVPTTASGPLGINVVGSTIVFTEYNANKIGTLSLTTR